MFALRPEWLVWALAASRGLALGLRSGIERVLAGSPSFLVGAGTHWTWTYCWLGIRIDKGKRHTDKQTEDLWADLADREDKLLAPASVTGVVRLYTGALGVFR